MFTDRKVLPVMFIALLLPMQVRSWWNPVDLFKKSPGWASLGVATVVAAAGVAIYNFCSGSDQTVQPKCYQEFNETQEKANEVNKELGKVLDTCLNKMSLDDSEKFTKFRLFQKASAQENSKPRIVGTVQYLTSKNGQIMKLFVVIKGLTFKYCVAFPAEHPTDKKKCDITMYDHIFGAEAKVMVNLKFNSEEEKSIMKRDLIKFYEDNRDIGRRIK